ncbi:MAG: exonuclease domain-containing protein [Oceanicaulis sp.]
MIETIFAAALALQPVTPETDPDSFVLAIIDVETTGLQPGHHEMIDIGAVYTDLDGAVLGRFFIRMTPDHPERAGEIARGINGFDEERWVRLGAVGEAEAAEAFLDFHRKTTGGRTALFTAYNAHFDRAFVDAWLKEEGHEGVSSIFTYFMVDLPSLAWGRGYRGLYGSEIAAALGIEPETDDPLQHTGESGAAWNLEFYRALMAAEGRD